MVETLRAQARAALDAALAAVEPRAAVRAHLAREGERLMIGGEELELPRRVWVIGAGKASAPMAAALEELLGERIAGGAVVVKDGHGCDLERVRLHEAAHPVPDARGAAAARDLAAVVDAAAAEDLILACWSGGASALLAEPAPGVSLADYHAVTRLLLASGLAIDAANTVRKHLSLITGGRLAARSAAPIRALVVSDVPGDDPAVIASGPTCGDPTTFADALRVCAEGGLGDELPAAVRRHLERGAAGEIAETPEDAALAHVRHHLVADNAQALAAAAERLREAGHAVTTRPGWLSGEAAERGRELAEDADPCVVVGGETTVVLGADPGTGGRNQEFALAAADALQGEGDTVVLAAGTDGTDGPTDAAGGLVDGGTWRRVAEAGRDPRRDLATHDAYPALDAAGDLLRTGPTCTNVMDIAILLRG